MSSKPDMAKVMKPRTMEEKHFHDHFGAAVDSSPSKILSFAAANAEKGKCDVQQVLLTMLMPAA